MHLIYKCLIWTCQSTCKYITWMHMTTHGERMLRLLILTILQAKKKVICHFGLPCASWVLLSRATTARTWLAPLGDTTVAAVRLGNLLTSRTESYSKRDGCIQSHNIYQYSSPIVYPYIIELPGRMCLLIYLVLAHEGHFTLEQPATSLIFRHPRFLEIISKIKATWYMTYCFLLHSFVAHNFCGSQQSNEFPTFGGARFPPSITSLLGQGLESELLDATPWKQISQKERDIFKHPKHLAIQNSSFENEEPPQKKGSIGEALHRLRRKETLCW